MKRIKEILTRNIGLKILSFLLAVLLWVSIMSFDDPYITETISGIKVEVINDSALGDKLYEIVSGKTMSITIRAVRSIVDTLKAADFIAVADFTQLSYVNAVPINVYLNPSTNSYTAYDVEITTQNPAMMTLTMEDRVEELFNIEAIVIGEVKEGYYINDVIINPINPVKMMNVKATSRQMDKINKIVLEVDVTDADESFSRIVYPIAYDENGDEIDSSYIVYDYPEIQVDVEVLPTKQIQIITTQVGSPQDGYLCTGLLIPSPMKVTIAGASEELDSIASYFICEVDVTGLTTSIDYTINIEDALKQKFIDKNYIVLEKKTVDVRINIEKLEEREILIKTSDIEIKNLADGYSAKFLMESEIKVKVRGLLSIIEGVTAESLRLYVDMQGKGAGPNYMYVLSDKKADFEVSSPATVIEIFTE